MQNRNKKLEGQVLICFKYSKYWKNNETIFPIN